MMNRGDRRQPIFQEVGDQSRFVETLGEVCQRSGSQVHVFDYRLEHDRRFLQRIESARSSIRAGRGVRIEDLDSMLKASKAPNQRGVFTRIQSKTKTLCQLLPAGYN